MEKRRKLSRKIIRVLLTFMLLVTSMEVSVPAAPRITIREGKVYQNNKPVTNKIVGSKAKGYYYVDKTGLIKTLLQGEMDQVTLITRPRRFGKTMAMNTMCRLRRQVIMATTKKC